MSFMWCHGGMYILTFHSTIVWKIVGSSDQKSSIRTLASKCCVSYKVVVARERCAPGNDSISAQKKTLSSWYLTLTCPRLFNNGTCKQIRRFLRRENFEKVSTTQANRNQLRFWIIYARIPVFLKHLLSICCFSPAVEDAVVELQPWTAWGPIDDTSKNYKQQAPEKTTSWTIPWLQLQIILHL